VPQDASKSDGDIHIYRDNMSLLQIVPMILRVG